MVQVAKGHPERGAVVKNMEVMRGSMLETDLEVMRTMVMCDEVEWMGPLKPSYQGETSGPGMESSHVGWTSYSGLAASPFVLP